MRRSWFLFWGLLSAVAVGGCSLFHGDPNDVERGSGGVGVLQPRMRPPADAGRAVHPVLPLSDTGK